MGMKYSIRTLILWILLLTSINVGAQIMDSLSLFPVPATNYVNVHLETSLFGRFDAQVFSVTGELMDEPFTDSIIWPGTYDWLYQISSYREGVYLYELKTSTGESRVAKFVKVLVVSINELEENNSECYPNPAQNTIHISSNISEYCIYDLSGRLMLSKQNTDNIIDVSNLVNGMYIIDLQGASIQRRQLVIQH